MYPYPHSKAPFEFESASNAYKYSVLCFNNIIGLRCVGSSYLMNKAMLLTIFVTSFKVYSPHDRTLGSYFSFQVGS